MIILPENYSEDSKSQGQRSPPLPPLPTFPPRARSQPPGQYPDAPSETDEPPPSYYSSETQNPRNSNNSGSSSSVIPTRPTIPPVRASNFTTLSVSNSAIKGTYAIDPAISIPVSVLPPLRYGETEENRNNLLLQTTNGSINVDVYISSTSYEARSTLKRKRALFSASTRNGSVKIRLHELLDISSQQSKRLPIVLTCESSNGSIDLRVPRSFCGPLRIRSWNGSVQFSDAMNPSVTTFSQIDKVHRCFLGPMDPHELDLGDELHVESKNGSIKLFYDDEGSVAQPKSQSFIGRLLFF